MTARDGPTASNAHAKLSAGKAECGILHATAGLPMRSLPKLFFFTCISGCALLPVAARAETIDISDNHGGSVAQYNARWTELAGRGVNVRIIGPWPVRLHGAAGSHPAQPHLRHTGSEL